MAKVPNTVQNCGNYYYLSRVHEHYRRQTTDGRATAYSERKKLATYSQKFSMGTSGENVGEGMANPG